MKKKDFESVEKVTIPVAIDGTAYLFSVERVVTGVFAVPTDRQLKSVASKLREFCDQLVGRGL